MTTNRPCEMLVLAGGFGTRLQSVVKDVPKPMAPVAGRPFLEYLLDYWITQGIQRFVLSTGHLGGIIKSHFGNKYKDALIDYVYETKPLGTGGALRSALNEISWANKIALMVNGDTWFPVNLDKLLHDSLKQNTSITLALKTIEKNVRYGGVQVNDNGLIEKFGVASEHCTNINAGCYLFQVDELRKALSEFPNTFSLETSFLHDYAIQGHVGSSIQDQPFLDIGIPSDYQQATKFFT